MPSQAAAEATRALLERVVEIGARRLQRRRQAEDQTGRERDDHRERKHGAVDADLLNVRQVEPAQRAKDAGAPEREQQPQRAAEQREQRAFGQQLADQAKPSGAESGADGDLALARRRARQQQVRGVGAGDEQNESDRTEENQKGKLHVRDHMLVQADELDEALRSEQGVRGSGPCAAKNFLSSSPCPSFPGSGRVTRRPCGDCGTSDRVVFANGSVAARGGLFGPIMTAPAPDDGSLGPIDPLAVSNGGGTDRRRGALFGEGVAPPRVPPAAGGALNRSGPRPITLAARWLRRSLMVSSSALACCIVTPGFRRATTCTSEMRIRPCSAVSSSASGSQIWNGSGNRNAGGRTPMTV